MINQALILCGGLGTRLRPLTNNIPKPMVPVDGKPFLEHQINYLKTFGVNKIVLATGYLHEKIESHFKNTVTYSRETKKLGTGGAIKLAEKLLDQEFLVLNGDTFFKLDYNKFYNFHNKNNSKLSLALKNLEDVKSSGFVEIDNQNKIINFSEKDSNQTKGLVNAGMYIVNRSILKLIPTDTEISIECDVFPKLLKKIYGHQDNGYFIDIGTFDNYNKFIKEFNNIV